MVRQLAWFAASPFAILLCLSCATSQDGPPAATGDSAPGDRTVKPAGRSKRIPTTRQPTQDELSAAFEPPAESEASGGLKGTGQVPQRSLEPDPLAPKRQAFPPQEVSVQTLIGSRDARAVQEANALVKLGSELGPAYVTRAWRLVFQAAVALDDSRAAHKAAMSWLLSCGPDEVDPCRAAALAALGQGQKSAGASSRAAAVLKEARKADRCLRTVEAAARRSGQALPSCADDAHRTYRRQRDLLMAARLLLARGKAQPDAPQAQRDLTRATRECTQPRCARVRQEAWETLTELHLAAGAPKPAARAALQAVAARTELLTPEEKRWAWTDTAQKACDAYDQEAGPGACRKLERSIVGFHTFRDYSKGGPAGDGLSRDIVREVNAHFAVTLTPCLTDEARRLRPPAQEQYPARWVVLNDGRVGELHMERKVQEDTALARCLREQLSFWRYPRYEGEYQHVQQTFGVKAARR